MKVKNVSEVCGVALKGLLKHRSQWKRGCGWAEIWGGPVALNGDACIYRAAILKH